MLRDRLCSGIFQGRPTNQRHAEAHKPFPPHLSKIEVRQPLCQDCCPSSIKADHHMVAGTHSLHTIICNHCYCLIPFSFIPDFSASDTLQNIPVCMHTCIHKKNQITHPRSICLALGGNRNAALPKHQRSPGPPPSAAIFFFYIHLKMSPETLSEVHMQPLGIPLSDEKKAWFHYQSGVPEYYS